MNGGEWRYIWQSEAWPRWHYDLALLATPLSRVTHAQGRLLGRLADVGMDLQQRAILNVLTGEVLQSSVIEGERLNGAAVRSSLARRLGVDEAGVPVADRAVEGMVQMVLDATLHYRLPLTAERLFAWQAALFPTGYSGMLPIRVGGWRDDSRGPMQVVTGPIGRQRVHYEAPPAARVAAEMAGFLVWINEASEESPIVRAGVAHLWFVTVHPFEDGNGRIARAIAEWLLARADGTPQRFYSLSAQIEREKKSYYLLLEQAQKGTLSLTDWLLWFLAMVEQAIIQAEQSVASVLSKARFWQRLAGIPLNERQIKLLNRLLDGFSGHLTSSKWAAIGKCSQDSALRDINDLLARGILSKTSAGGRSSRYLLTAELLE
ncbi:MAG: Fic family protein [Magnetococcales bacterium]|nr:Fic family protein [Magnetococcales bacterium]